jgi:hypothetical protein
MGSKMKLGSWRMGSGNDWNLFIGPRQKLFSTDSGPREVCRTSIGSSFLGATL